MTSPCVSAITVTYNYGRFLARTLDSALAQEYPPECLEIVVVDDGSTDDTPAILAEYAARFPGRIRAVRQDNAGYVAATNRAFEEATGELWAFLDADDLWPPQKLKVQTAIFAANPRVGAVYGDLEIIDADDRVVRPSHWVHDGVTPLSGGGCLTSLLCNGNVAGSSSIMVRASLSRRFAPVPAMVPYVDWWTVMQAAAVSDLEFIREPRVGYRAHGSNLTFGASGMTLAREKIKQSLTRRATIINGGAAALPPDALERAWSAIERDAIEAVQAAGTVFLDLPRAQPADTAAADRLTRRAASLLERGRLVEARRTMLVAASRDPFAASVREHLPSILAADQVAVAGPDVFENAHSFVIYVELEQLAAAPDRFRGFFQGFGPEDSATLFIYAPAVTSAEAAAEVRNLLKGISVSAEPGPHMVLQPDPGSSMDRLRFVRLADALLLETSAAALRDRFDEAVAAIELPRG